MATQQLYQDKPIELADVKGLSSQFIFAFMTGIPCDQYHPLDVDDWERNRALLICYPEWKSRLSEMTVVSKEWKVLIDSWDLIETKYNEDYQQFGDKAFDHGQCDQLIRSLLRSVIGKYSSGECTGVTIL